mgnify:CR=1 FL=1
MDTDIRKTQLTQPISLPEPDKMEIWFQELIGTIKVHELQLSTQTASSEIQNLYSKLIGGNFEDIYHKSKEDGNKYFIGKLVLDYLLLIKEIPVTLALSFSGSKVLAWAEIDDEREDLEDFLLMSEAEVNAKYSAYGYDLTTTIVEKSDSLEVPSHYSPIAISAGI